MPSLAPVLSLSDVSLVLGGKRVLNHLDWKVMPGESWAVVGPNGAGKTSLVSVINGYRWPSSGEVSVLGRLFGRADLRELRTLTGVVSSYVDKMSDQGTGVVEFVVGGLSGSTRVWLGRAGRTEATRARALLRGLGCPSGPAVTLGTLSQGERQKAAIARAQMARPSLLVLDEPCEGLDIASRESLMSGLASLLRARGHRASAVVEVTHRTEDIPPGFTHALLLRGGEVVASGEIGSTLTSRYLTRCLGVGIRLRRWEGRYYMTPKR